MKWYRQAKWSVTDEFHNLKTCYLWGGKHCLFLSLLTIRAPFCSVYCSSDIVFHAKSLDFFSETKNLPFWVWVDCVIFRPQKILCFVNKMAFHSLPRMYFIFLVGKLKPCLLIVMHASAFGTLSVYLCQSCCWLGCDKAKGEIWGCTNPSGLSDPDGRSDHKSLLIPFCDCFLL